MLAVNMDVLRRATDTQDASDMPLKTVVHVNKHTTTAVRGI